MYGRVSLGHSNVVHYSGFYALWRYSYQHCWYHSTNYWFFSLVVLAELTLFLLHNFSYCIVSMICLKCGEAFFFIWVQFLQVMQFRERKFLKHVNYMCLHSLLVIFEASKPEWSHESNILFLLDSRYCSIYTDCSFYFLVVLSSKLRYILTGVFFLQAINDVFGFVWGGFWFEKPLVNTG